MNTTNVASDLLSWSEAVPKVEFGVKVSYFTLVVLSSLIGSVGNTMVVFAVLYFKVRIRKATVQRLIYRRTIELLQWTRICKVNCCLKVHNAQLKLASPISG